MPSLRTALLAAWLAIPLAAAEPVLLPDEGETSKDKLFTLIEAGSAIAVGSDLGFLPQLGCFRDLPHAWQLGLQARIAPQAAQVPYDYLPHVDFSLRKLWLGDEDAAPIRNSEYFAVSLGGYFAYDFEGNRDGLKPFGTVSLGKYWMPFEARPLGLDLSLDLTRYMSGHLPGRSELVFITFGANVFYAIP